MAGDARRRLEKIEQALGAEDAHYAPAETVKLCYTRRWRQGTTPAEADAAELQEAARTAACDQIASWCAEDARRHGWAQRYTLVVTFEDDEVPNRARFRLPWRVGELAWPEIADAVR